MGCTRTDFKKLGFTEKKHLFPVRTKNLIKRITCTQYLYIEEGILWKVFLNIDGNDVIKGEKLAFIDDVTFTSMMKYLNQIYGKIREINFSDL